MERKVIGTILGVVALIVVVAGSTAAWFTWQSTEGQKTNVSFTVSGLSDTVQTNINESSSTLTGTLTPVANKSDGLVKTFTVTKSASFAPNVYLSFTMTLTAFPAGLAHQSLKWEFVSVGSGETTLGSGNLGSASQGDSIKLLTSPATRHQLGSTTNTYKLYIWIDGTQSNPSSMQNQDYTFTITIDGTDNASAGL
ncbi:MAG: hypothetical protein ACI4VR_03530 [Bacilli bacterium]